jgi:hypothetical protein
MQDVHAERTSRAQKRWGSGGPLLAIAAIALVAACTTGRSDTPPVELRGRAEASSYVRLDRVTSPLARPESDVGRLDANRVLHNLSIVWKPTPAQRAERDALLEDLQRPGSPSYHRWLTPDEYAARFGADPATIAKTEAWLAVQGLTVNEPSPLAARTTFTGTVAQIEAAFPTELHAYEVEGERHYAMARRPPSPPRSRTACSGS